jgi:hypothetical protein
MSEYYNDYPKIKIGKGNPYYMCKCGVSDPQINGKLENHSSDCEWALNKHKEVNMKNNKLWRIAETLEILSLELDCSVKEIVYLLEGQLLSEEEASQLLSEEEATDILFRTQ